MKKNLLLFVVLLLIGIGMQAQPDIKHSLFFKDKYCNEFFKNYWHYTYVHSSGNVYVVFIKSTINGMPYEDSYFCKLNAQWDTVWTKKYAGSYEDRLEMIRELPNGNMLLAGYTSSHDGDVWYGHSYSAREIWMIEVDTMGNMLKGTTFGGGNGSELTDVIISKDGYIYLAGNTIADDYDFTCVNYGNLDASAWVAKYDTAFNKIWINMYVGDGDDAWPTIKEVNPNRFIIGYQTNSTSIEADPINIKGGVDLLVQYIDSAGTTLWKKRYGSWYDEGSRKSVVDTITKDIYFIGDINNNNSNNLSGDLTYKSGTIWIHKIDTLGNVKGSKAYGAITDLTYTNDAIWYDGGLYIFAQSAGGGGDMDPPVGVLGANNTWIALIDSNVNLVGKKTLSVEGTVAVFNAFMHSNDLYMATYVGTYTNPYKCDTANVTSIIFNIGKAPLGINEIKKEKNILFEVYPNPTNNTIYIKIDNKYVHEKADVKVQDIEGRTVYRKKIQALQDQEEIECSNWISGNYTIKLTIGKNIQTRKIIKQ